MKTAWEKPPTDSILLPKIGVCQALPAAVKLGQAIETVRAAYWRAWHRADFGLADDLAQHYRKLLRDARAFDLEARLDALDRVMLEQEARLDALERELLGEGVHYA